MSFFFRHTSEHKDFWLFLEKYENFRSKKKQKGSWSEIKRRWL